MTDNAHAPPLREGAAEVRAHHGPDVDARRGGEAGHGPSHSGWWSRWGAVAALVWSAGAVTLGASWLLGYLANPFDDAGVVSMGAVLNAADPAVGATLVAVLGAAGIVTAVVVTQDPPPHTRWARRAAEAVGWVITGVCALLLVNGWLLMAMGYGLALPILALFLPDILSEYLVAVADPQLVICGYGVAGALIWGLVTLRYRRRLRRTCAHCGRGDDWSAEGERSSRLRTLRVGRAAVVGGALAALVYPATRFAWLFGVGMDMGELPDQALSIGLTLAGAAVVGVLLMTGLVSNWGVRFPRWAVGLVGRRVPVSLAVVPAVVVGTTLVAVGRGVLSLPHLWLDMVGGSYDLLANFVALAAMLPWGAALLVATAAYAVRRRAECDACGLGTAEAAPNGPNGISRAGGTTRSTEVMPR
ncbi:hypothetical protein J4H86_00375 [Spiractinospora alimapuensis]|uniref:hypothetical protein n=1 Tax=Spiractinospora alimapuensis TaxID=2820884 RepID=UPI001F45B0CE|nr:hypothetical protein [Spiractinospora alimapuensis]QVQ52368.1 hypothetical protein J4H86_00375 [Spiractinospora alimapuensis]